MKVASQTITVPFQCIANTEYDLTGATLERKSPGYCMVIPPGVNGVKITGGMLIGGGIKAEDTDSTTIDGVTVRNTFSASDGTTNNAFNLTRFTNSKLLNCRALDIAGTAYWFWGSLHKSLISRNLVNGAGEGFHSFHRGGAVSEDVVFEFNEARRIRRHAFEMQNYGIMRRWKVRYNLAHDWTTFADWPGHMAFSLACGQSDGMNGVEPDKGPAPYINDDFLVEHNVALATGDLLTWFKNGTAQTGSSCAFELMGNFTFQSNYIDGFPHATLSEFTRPGKFAYYDNTYLTFDGGPKCYHDTYTGYQGPPTSDSGNFYGKSGDKPVPAAGVSAGAPTPTPNPQPSPMPTFNLSVVAVSDTEVRYQWTGLPGLVDKVRLSAVTHVGLKPGPMVDVPPFPASFTLGGFTKNWNYDFSAIAMNAAGVVIAVSADLPALKDVKAIAPVTPPPPPPSPMNYDVITSIRNGEYVSTKKVAI